MVRTTRLPLLAAGATFLALLDVTVVNLAIPALGRAYPSSGLTALSWVITAYATLFAALLAPAGRLADVLGRQRLFRVGVAGFALTSLLCALSPSIPLLLVARGLQGGAAALMIPASLAVVLTDTPAERRIAAIGLWSAAGAFAAAVGPSLGGVLVHAFGWRSLFLINVPTGLVLAVLAGAIPQGGTRDSRLPDAVGTLSLAAGVGLLALGLSQGHVWGWGDLRTVAALAAGLIALGATLARSSGRAAPAVETALWRQRTFAFANVTSLLYGVSLYAWMLLGVLVLTELWGYSELKAGLAMTPGAVSASIAAILASRARGSAGPRNVTVAGALLMTACGLFTAATLPHHPEFLGYWLPMGLALGVGMGLVTTGTSLAASLSLPPAAFAAGTGLNQTARQIGAALGIATLSTLIGGRATSAATFEHVYVFCAIAALCAGLAGMRLVLRTAIAAPATEDNDPYLAGLPTPADLPWRRFVAVGDSMAEGVGEPSPGYAAGSWVDRIAEGIGGEHLNLGQRFLLAHEIRATQLQAALEFRPDLALVTAGGNDLIQPDHDLEAVEREVEAIVAALRAAGSDVVMIAPLDITRTELLPGGQRESWHAVIQRMSDIAQRVMQRHGGLFVDLRTHPAGAEPSVYSRDLIHLNGRGHAIAAAEMLVALERFAAERGREREQEVPAVA
jgi:EmrB/QacA subfamily drug resistance transporter